MVERGFIGVAPGLGFGMSREQRMAGILGFHAADMRRTSRGSVPWDLAQSGQVGGVGRRG